MKIKINISISKPSKQEEEMKKKEEDKLLLEKLKKYGMFNDKGEWVENESKVRVG